MTYGVSKQPDYPCFAVDHFHKLVLIKGSLLCSLFGNHTSPLSGFTAEDAPIKERPIKESKTNGEGSWN